MAMRLSQIRNFLAVLDAGSIQRAARTLSVSQPALTRSVRQLEEELNAKLFERSARGVSLTEEGRAFLARARLVQNELSRARDDLAQIRGTSSGHVRFGVTPESGMHVMPAALQTFRREHPSAEVFIVEGHPHALLPQLRDGSLDFVLGGRPRGPLEASVQSYPLFRTERLIAGRRGHPLRRSRTLQDLEDADWLVFAPSGWSASILPELFKDHGLRQPKSVVHCESYITLLALIAATDMIGALSSRVLKSPQGLRLFEPFALKEQLPSFAVHLFQRADLPLTVAAGAMVQAVKSAARRLAFSGPAA